MVKIFYNLMFFILLISTSIAQEKKVYVTGTAALDDKNNFSEINIEFQRLIPSQGYYNIITDSSGKFGFEIDEGIYNITLSKKFYDTVYIQNVNIFEDKDFGDIEMRYLGEYLSGCIKGILKSGEYEVRNYLTINNGDTLYIQDGTILKFHDNVKFLVYGCLIAIGNDNRRILFTSVTDSVYWSGISFQERQEKFDVDLKSTMKYVTIERSKGVGLNVNLYAHIEFDHIIYKNNLVCSKFCFINNPSIVRNSTFINNKSKRTGAIYLISANMDFENCVISFNESLPDDQIDHYPNAGTICAYILGGSSTNLRNCLIYSNKAEIGGGITLSGGIKLINCVIANNTATYSGCGINNYSSGSDIINCIISNNKLISDGNIINDYQIMGNKTEGCSIRNSIIFNEQSLYWNNSDDYFSKLIRTNFNGDSTDAYGNLFLDPKMVGLANNDFKLLSYSPGIDAGLNSEYLALNDFEDNERIWDGNNDNFAIADIGAYEINAPLGLNMIAVINGDCEPETDILEIADKNYDGNKFEISNQESHTGKHSLKLINSSGSSNDWIISEFENIVQGQNYYLSFWIKYSGEPFDIAKDKININYTKNDVDIYSQENKIFTTDKIEREWQKVITKLNTTECNNAKFAINAELSSNIELFIDDILVQTESILDINDIYTNNETGIFIYPNPCFESIKIMNDFEVINIQNARFKIYNTLANVVKQGNLNDNNTINISNLPQGIYYVQLYCRTKIIFLEFVINK